MNLSGISGGGGLDAWWASALLFIHEMKLFFAVVRYPRRRRSPEERRNTMCGSFLGVKNMLNGQPPGMGGGSSALSSLFSVSVDLSCRRRRA
jgi:hypothetical protein